MRRRSLFFTLMALVPSFSAAISPTQTKEPRYRKIRWQKLHEEEVGPGDFWASHNCDPNTPERQAEDGYNLQMQAVHPSSYGTKAKDIPRGNGDYWRPVGVTEVF